ncbi:carbon-nitrogen hydrolase family protein [Nonomuraea sp. K274]|uniref:Carbon-nitrogen hydrolase family protein n=1 Tax=Nonomuraea cypriaca TaxID=1187855 RepID=A0A931EYZ1_9ACTN|nr:carbon-nitrogen hydrolase family protein [Nonomuraea cypriaca]MBF8184583.1 carbon-nitrogen hydrolase family protein [Nonomuraea cypriaca]
MSRHAHASVGRAMTLTIATVNPLTHFGPDSYAANLRSAEQYVADASARGAQLVCLPETYPGEWRRPITRTPEKELSALARAHRVHLVGGFAEPVGGDTSRCYNTLVLMGPDGSELGRYRRTVPVHAPWIYVGGAYWDFDWVPGDDLPVFETELGRIGMLVCSEVYSPELPRQLALGGAELILMPAGLTGPQRHAGGHGGALFETWRTLAWARAIENLAVTAICANIPDAGDKGVSMICTPEQVALEEYGEGVHVATVDLDRVRWLRREQDRIVAGPSPWRTKPGVLRDWRRTDLRTGYLPEAAAQ